MAECLGCAELREIGRQYHEKDKQVVRDLVAGEAQSSLKNLAERGLVSVSKTREQAIEQLVADWSKDGASRAQETLIFCSTNREADELNRRCQLDRAFAGDVDSSRSVKVDRAHLCKGDRVLFTKNSRPLGVNNGDLGTVVTVNQLRKRVSVRIDSGKRVDVLIKKYNHKRGDRKGELALRLGYAVTTHKGQGSTVEKAYVLAGGVMQDREISYVQVSRARRETRVYTDEREAGKDLSRLARHMSTSREKDHAHDVAREREQERSRERTR